MKSVLISDIHLSPSHPELTQAFNHFIDSLPETVGELYILGDLFEFWLGDDDNSVFATDVIRKLQRLGKSGVRLYFQRGNRDYLVGRTFAKQIGCEILPDFVVRDICGHRVLLTHGDLLCTDDRAYQRFRKRFQNPTMKWISTRVPMSYRKRLVEQIRSKTKHSTSNKRDDIMDVNNTTVLEKFSQYNTKIMVHGHTHRPKLHSIASNERELRRFTLGDWGELIWWIEVDAHDLHLKSTPITSTCIFS